MRIALIYHQFLIKGGLEGYLVEFARQLRLAGHELELITADAPEAVVTGLQAKVTRIPVVKGSALLRMWQFERKAARAAEASDADVTIGFGRTTQHDLHRAGGGCHKVYSELLPVWKRWGIKNQLELDLEKKLYTGETTKLFVVNSSQVAKQLQTHYGTDPARFRVIHTAVDTERFKPTEDRQMLKSKVCGLIKSDASRPVFLFVSLSHRRKGLDALLEAWSDVDADLWIVGKGLDARYRAMISRLGVQNRVFAMARQSNVALLYQAADWFIHPTQYDACANTVLQSMAAGLPGLVSVHDGAIDLVKDGENGYLLHEPGDAASLRGVIGKALAASPEEWGRLSTAARETMLPLTWEAHVGKWMDVVGEIQRA